MKAIIAILFTFVSGIALMVFYVAKMPGKSPPSASTVLSDEERHAAERMKETCEHLAHQIGQRSTAKAANVTAARDFLNNRLHKAGLRTTEKPFATRGYGGMNLEAVIEGNGGQAEAIVLGAHYDTEAYSPGAGDNASGCAMLLEVAHEMAALPHARKIIIVFFDFGSARFAGSDDSGSHYWVEDARKNGTKVAAMLSFDALGVYNDAPGTQTGPFPLSVWYPKTGNFLMFAGDLGARALVQKCVHLMRTEGAFPTEGLTLPGMVPGIDSSDHYAFRQNGWPAVVVTDTGPYRNTEDGTPSDTPDRLNYDRMAKVWTGLVKLVDKLAQAGQPTLMSVN